MSLATCLPDDLPWTEHQGYLLVDSATRPDWPPRLKSLDPTAHAVLLYDHPPFYALRDISAQLFPIEQLDTPVMRFYLEQSHDESAVLLFSPLAVHEVAQHLRKLLTVEIAEGQHVMLRLADAAVAQALFDGSDQRLFGPLSCVVTADSLSATWCCQRPRRPDRPELPTPYRLSPEQNLALDRVDRRRALLDLDAHLRRFFPDFQKDLGLVERWPLLERLETQACALGLSSPSELLYYANLMAWLDGTTLDQHPDIARLLQAPSLQPIGERVVLAAERAQRWASQRGQP